MNVFPAGFNNLSEDGIKKAISIIKGKFPPSSNILIILENHTRNVNYLRSAATLQRIFTEAGMNATLVNTLENQSLSEELEIHQLNKTHIANANYIILNNDLTTGIPDILTDIKTLPPTQMGWHSRKKSHHFEQYDKIATKFCTEFNIDPWLISSYWHKCGNIDFRKKEGLECVARNVEKLLHKIRKKHAEYGVTDEPYVFVKADNGTYGMGIMVVKSGEEIFAINKKNRNKMNMVKEGVQNTAVIIQEGIPTVDAVDGHPAENLIYIMNGEPIEDIRRINANRDRFSSLNTAGMTFSPDSQIHPALEIIAKLSIIATSMEL